MLRPLVCLLSLCLSALLAAQEFPLSNSPDSLQARLMTKAPTVDGSVGAEEWAGAATSSRSLVVISTSQPSGDKGQYWIGYDDKYVYVAARIILADPKHVRADEYRENVNLDGDDTVTFYLDPFGNAQNFSTFTFNSAGATQLQIAGGRAAKKEWGGAFEARGKVTETGWEGEARVEWAIIPLPPEGARNMKFLFDWYVSSSQRGVSFHATQGDFNKTHSLNGVVVPNIPIRRTVSALPYAYVGYNDETKSTITNAGIDLKAAVTDSLNAVVTVSPDFRNIENQILDLDFSNFERLPGESRPFFLEGSQFLLTGGINMRQLFASQRIGAFDTGINFYGNLSDKAQIGALGIIDVGNQHAFVSSVSLSPDPSTTIIGAFTALDRKDEENFGGNIEYFKRSGDFLLFTGFMQTDDEQTGKGTSLAGGYQYMARGLLNVLIYEQVSPDFNPRIGFAPQTGYKGLVTNTRWTKTHPRGAVIETRLTGTFVKQDQFEGGRYRNLGSVSASATFRNSLNVQLSTAQDNFLSQYNTFYTLSASMPSDDRFRGWQLTHTSGDVAGDPYESTTARAYYRPIKRLQLDLRHQFVNHTVDSDQTVFTMNWEMDRYQSIGGRLVSQDGELNWFVSFKRSGNLGAEYYLIVGDPNASSFQKTLIFKVTVPLSIG